MNRNWIADYSENKVRSFQVGGQMPEGGMPPQEAQQGGAPDLESMLMEYAQTRDPQLAVAICDMLLEALAQQQGGAPAGAPAEGAPMARNGRKMSKAPIF